jgi:hypothetical protein
MLLSVLYTKVKSREYKCSLYQISSVTVIVHVSLQVHIFLSALLHLPSIFAILFELDIQFSSEDKIHTFYILKNVSIWG